jgi:hypothetical protein
MEDNARSLTINMGLWNKDTAPALLSNTNRIVLVDEKAGKLRGFVSWIWGIDGDNTAYGDYAATDTSLGASVRRSVTVALFKAGFQIGLDRGVAEVVLSGPIGTGSYLWLRDLGIMPVERGDTAIWRVDMASAIVVLR